MDKGKAEEDSLLDNIEAEADGRKSREINIDMLADRRDSFEVARISSPEVGSSFSIFHQTSADYTFFSCARVCDQSTALQLSNPPIWPTRHHW